MPKEKRKLRRGWKLFDVYTVRKYKIQIQTYVGTADGNKRGHYGAEYANEWVEGETYDAMIVLLLKVVERNSAITWFPVLQIEVTPHETHNWQGRIGAGLELEITRYYIGQRTDQTWAMVDWKTEEDHRVENSNDFSIWYYPEQPTTRMWRQRATWEFKGLPELPLHLPDETPENFTHYIPYTEQLWNGLQEIQSKLRLMRTHLDKLIGSTGGLRAIEAAGGRLLMASAEAVIDQQEQPREQDQD